MHRSHIFLLILLAFIGGVFLGSFLAIPQNYVWMGFVICVGIIAVFFRRDSKLLRPKIAFGALIAIIFLSGFTRINIIHSQKHLLEKFAMASAGIIDPEKKREMKTELTGYINSEPEKSGKSQSFVFKSKYLPTNGNLIETHESVLIYTDLFPEYEYGQQLKIYGRIKLPENTPDSQIDYAAYLAKDDIFTLMSFPEISGANIELSFLEKMKLSFFKKIYRFKTAFQSSVNRSISEPNAAFINGILLGTRSQIPDDLKKAFSATSTTHILAISGFNITIVAGLIASFFLLFFKRKTAFWFSILGVAIFTILTGAQASVARAAIMGCLLLLAQREGRPYASRNAIIFAGAIMILINPNILRYDVGFQLSFAATLGLIYLNPFFSKKLKKISSIFNFKENLTMTISAQVAVLPLLLFYFKNLSIVSLPTNILILPLVPISMLFGFLSGIFGMFVPFLGVLAGYFAWFTTSIQIFIVKLFAGPSWASVSVNFPWYALAVVYMLGLWLIYKLAHDKSGTK